LENKNKVARADKAFEMYKQGLKLVEIANQLGVAEGTVRSWKNRYKWAGDNATLQRSKRNVAKNSKTLIKNKESPVAHEVESVMKNTELTDKQQLFCIYYIRCFNATKAYQKAYGCNYTTAMSEGSKHLRNPKIKEEIFRLKQERLNREFLSESDIFQKYMDIAFADITDYVEFGNGSFNDPETGEEVSYSFVNLKDSKTVDGTIVSEVSKGREGAKIKLADRMKALQWLTDHMDLATDKQKAEIALLRAKVQTDDSEEIADDGFLEALNGTAAEDWSNEENQ
jgi:phage terminase small subunit